MVNDIRVHMAILMYLTGCISLMAYNAVVIFHKKNSSQKMLKNTNKWIKSISQKSFGSKYKKHLIKNLKHVEKLIAFSNALNYFKRKQSDESYSKYMNMLVQSEIFRTLAIAYRHKKNEERAYFAYFISQYPQLAKNTEGICIDTINTIVSYIETSDIYCRSNVLKALCRVGDMHGIANVLQSFSDNLNFIHHRLLAEDLFSFAGNKEVLALYLWEKYKLWNSNIMLGVITFITMFSDVFKDAFLPILQNKSTNDKICIAIIRYYKAYSFKPAQPILVEYLNQTENYDFAIEAAATLSAYPGQDTIHALIAALQSNNWHVRYSAASSLVTLGEYPDHLINNPNNHGDALQLVQYMLAHTSNEKSMNVSEVII